MTDISDIADALRDVFDLVHEPIDFWRHHEVHPSDVVDDAKTWSEVSLALTKAACLRRGLDWTDDLDAFFAALRRRAYGPIRA